MIAIRNIKDEPVIILFERNKLACTPNRVYYALSAIIDSQTAYNLSKIQHIDNECNEQYQWEDSESLDKRDIDNQFQTEDEYTVLLSTLPIR